MSVINVDYSEAAINQLNSAAPPGHCVCTSRGRAGMPNVATASLRFPARQGHSCDPLRLREHQNTALAVREYERVLAPRVSCCTFRMEHGSGYTSSRCRGA
jgi:hypothetical protein